MTALSRLLILITAAALLSGCESLNRAFNSEDDDILPGRRIPVQINQGSAISPSVSRAQVAAPSRGSNWTQAGSSATNLTPNFATDRSLTRQWSRDIGARTTNQRAIVAQPLIVQGVVFSLDAVNTVRASSLASGRTLWSRDLDPTSERSGFFGGGIAYDNGIIYLSTGFRELIALRARSGAELWRRQLPGISRGAPTIANGRLLVQTLQNKTRAYDAASGRLLWDHEGASTQTGLLGTASPAVAQGRVIVGYSSGEVFALDLNDGSEIWSDTLAGSTTGSLTAEIGDVRAQPVIAGSTVYVVSNTGRTAAFDLGRGALLWEAPVGGSQTPVVSGNALFLMTGGARAVALDQTNGGQIWQTQLKKGRSRFLRSDFPVAWKGPLLVGGRLMFGSSTGEVVSLNPADGAVQGQIDVGAPVAVAPVAANGSALILTDRAQLIALR